MELGEFTMTLSPRAMEYFMPQREQVTIVYPSPVPRHNAPKKRKRRIRKKITAKSPHETLYGHISGFTPSADGNAVMSFTFEGEAK